MLMQMQGIATGAIAVAALVFMSGPAAGSEGSPYTWPPYKPNLNYRFKVSGAGAISVDFQPIGGNMSCQLVYRAVDGSVVYSAPVTKGTCSLAPSKPVKNNVVIAVICNTDYVFNGDASRKAKYDYRLMTGSGIEGTADINTKWWD